MTYTLTWEQKQAIYDSYRKSRSEAEPMPTKTEELKAKLIAKRYTKRMNSNTITFKTCLVCGGTDKPIKSHPTLKECSCTPRCPQYANVTWEVPTNQPPLPWVAKVDSGPNKGSERLRLFVDRNPPIKGYNVRSTGVILCGLSKAETESLLEWLSQALMAWPEESE